MSNLQLYKEQIEFLSELQTKIINRIISVQRENYYSESLEELSSTIIQLTTNYKCRIADEILQDDKIYNIAVQAVNELYESFKDIEF